MNDAARTGREAALWGQCEAVWWTVAPSQARISPSGKSGRCWERAGQGNRNLKPEYSSLRTLGTSLPQGGWGPAEQMETLRPSDQSELPGCGHVAKRNNRVKTGKVVFLGITLSG